MPRDLSHVSTHFFNGINRKARKLFETSVLSMNAKRDFFVVHGKVPEDEDNVGS